jgi:effector-binding domain-containing protein
MPYQVSLEDTPPRPIAAVRAHMRVANVATQFGKHLNRVYEAARSGTVLLDGQNIFVYHAPVDDNGEIDVEFAVGATRPFAPVGDVTYSATPGGRVATTTHWGEYSALGAAHEAVITWCRVNGHRLTGTRWEVYGHHSDDPAQRRTDIFYAVSP